MQTSSSEDYRRAHPLPDAGCLSLVLAHPGLSPTAWRQLQFPDGARILAEGDISGYLYVVSAGGVRIEGTVQLESGRRFQAGVTRLGVGGVFGELSLFDQQPHSASIYADGTTTIVAIEGPALLEFLDAHPLEGYAVFKEFLVQMAPRLRATSRRVYRFLAWGLRAYHLDQ